MMFVCTFHNFFISICYGYVAGIATLPLLGVAIAVISSLKQNKE